jgi:hypothetical protein
MILTVAAIWRGWMGEWVIEVARVTPSQVLSRSNRSTSILSIPSSPDSKLARPGAAPEICNPGPHIVLAMRHEAVFSSTSSSICPGNVMTEDLSFCFGERNRLELHPISIDKGGIKDNTKEDLNFRGHVQNPLI